MRGAFAVDGLEYNDRAYVDFIRNAIDEGSQMFEGKIEMSDDVTEAARWTIQRSSGAVMRAREQIIQRIEARAAGLRREGAVERWMANASSDVARVAEGVNGPLFSELLREAEWVDQDVVGFFREARARSVTGCARRGRRPVCAGRATCW